MLIKNKFLIIETTKREIQDRYKGSVFGALWIIATPLIMLAVYTFVFSVVFQARWDIGNGSKAEFAAIVYLGMILFNFFAETVNRASNQIRSNINYVKKVVYPLETLTITTTAANLFFFFTNLVVWILFYITLVGALPASALLLPITLIPLILLTLGVAWFVAAIAAYLKDTAQIIMLFTTALMFLSPIFYPISAIPENFQSIVLLNPIADIIEINRQLVIAGKLPSLTAFIISLSSTGFVALLGLFIFQKLKKGFSDVL